MHLTFGTELVIKCHYDFITIGIISFQLFFFLNVGKMLKESLIESNIENMIGVEGFEFPNRKLVVICR